MSEPLDIDVADRARQLQQQGLAVGDIAQLLRTHPLQVERWLASTDHEAAAATCAQRWQEQQR